MVKIFLLSTIILSAVIFFLFIKNEKRDFEIIDQSSVVSLKLNSQKKLSLYRQEINQIQNKKIFLVLTNDVQSNKISKSFSLNNPDFVYSYSSKLDQEYLTIYLHVDPKSNTTSEKTLTNIEVEGYFLEAILQTEEKNEAVISKLERNNKAKETLLKISKEMNEDLFIISYD